jgi:hypothetical protein
MKILRGQFMLNNSPSFCPFDLCKEVLCFFKVLATEKGLDLILYTTKYTIKQYEIYLIRIDNLLTWAPRWH